MKLKIGLLVLFLLLYNGPAHAMHNPIYYSSHIRENDTFKWLQTTTNYNTNTSELIYNRTSPIEVYVIVDLHDVEHSLLLQFSEIFAVTKDGYNRSSLYIYFDIDIFGVDVPLIAPSYTENGTSFFKDLEDHKPTNEWNFTHYNETSVIQYTSNSGNESKVFNFHTETGILLKHTHSGFVRGDYRITIFQLVEAESYVSDFFYENSRPEITNTEKNPEDDEFETNEALVSFPWIMLWIIPLYRLRIRRKFPT